MTHDRARRAAELADSVVVDLLRRLIRFDTTVYGYDDPARDDAALQAFVADFLAGLGAQVELFEPDPAELAGHPRLPEDLSFAGRPVLWARFPGSGAGRSLVLNGHIDTVPSGPLEDWRFPPWEAVLADGRVWGRGAADMKGGIATALAVMHGLVHAGVELAGDVVVNTVPYEEISGMGTVATVRRGYRADGVIALEPSGLDVPQTACRGLLIAELTVHGRSAHAEAPVPETGFGVSAIDKLLDVLGALRELGERWSHRPDKQHPVLTTPHILPTLIAGGDFAYTYPAQATVTLNIPYLPGEADDDGFGGRVRDEVEGVLARLGQDDPWLREHPPTVRWTIDMPPMELPPDEPLIHTLTAAAARHGVAAAGRASDIWSDMATFTIEAGIPALSWGGGSSDQAHAVDEHIAVDQLTTATAILVDVVLAWTGSDAS